MGGPIGQSVRRKEGIEKVTGRAVYADDLKFENVLYGRTVRSTVPRGRVKEIRFRDGVPWDEFTVVLPKDIPGENAVTLIEKSQPFLAEYVKHIAEPVALVAHPDKAMASKALEYIDVEIEEAPAIFEIEEALSGENVQYGEDNVFKSFRIQRGDVKRGFAEAEFVLEGEYRTGAQEHLYIEPNGLTAEVRVEGGRAVAMTVWGSMQCPFYIRKALAPLFALEEGKIRVVQTETGGGFGGKEEYPNLLAGHAALLSWKSGGRPVKMIYDRREDMWATTKRHPSRTRIKAGFKKDGTITALAVDFVLNGGAYPTLSSTVLSRGILHSFGPYRIPHADLRGRVVFTNSNPYGAFRGFGAPQSIFAIECHMTRAAEALGLDPAEIRRRNFLRKGDEMPTGQVMKEEIDLAGLMDRALKKAGWAEKRARFARENEAAARRGDPIRRGIGLSTFFHGSGFTGAGEVLLASQGAVRLLPDGTPEVLAANVEYGQGTNTTFAQIVAETLRIPVEKVSIHRPDTAVVPNSGPTVASRTTMIVGGLIEHAAKALRARVVAAGGLDEKYEPDDFLRSARELVAREGEVRETVRYEPPKDIQWDEKNYRGAAYAAYSWSCDVCEIEVDLRDYFAKPVHFVSVVECGKVLNPVLAAGQIEGGIVQSIGFALYEDCRMHRGEMVNHQYTNYIIPTSADVGRIEVEFVEFAPSGPGPFHAKGIGELPADGPAPAVAAAVAQALRTWIPEVPILPEKILAALRPKERAA